MRHQRARKSEKSAIDSKTGEIMAHETPAHDLNQAMALLNHEVNKSFERSVPVTDKKRAAILI